MQVHRAVAQSSFVWRKIEECSSSVRLHDVGKEPHDEHGREYEHVDLHRVDITFDPSLRFSRSAL